MGGYYAYIIGDDGHITDRVSVFGKDDVEAKRLAKQLVDGQPVELWQEARMIARFEPGEQRDPSRRQNLNGLSRGKLRPSRYFGKCRDQRHKIATALESSSS